MDEIIRDIVKVAWYESGEGYYGDYDEDDKGDVELLRFDTYRYQAKDDRSYGAQRATFDFNVHPEDDETWVSCEDGSYCTLVPKSATPEQRGKLLEILMNNLHDPIVAGDYKHLAEEMSWIDLDWLLVTNTPS